MNTILEWLQEVQHPAKGDQSIVALGMVESIEEADGRIHVTLAFPKRPDPLKNYLVGAVQAWLSGWNGLKNPFDAWTDERKH